MVMQDRTIGRREFLTGLFRGRKRSSAITDLNGLAHEPRGTGAALNHHGAPELPDWERNMDRVLTEMNDLKGIEEP